MASEIATPVIVGGPGREAVLLSVSLAADIQNPWVCYALRMARQEMGPEVTLWTDGGHVELLRALMDVMGSAISLIAVGGPREAAVDGLGASLGVEREDDFRKMLVERPAAYLVVGAMAGIEAADVAAAGAQGTTILALEPVAADVTEAGALRHGERGRGAGAKVRVVHLPGFVKSPGFVRAAEPFDLLGDRRMIRFDSYGRRGDGSLFSRLFDAWHTVLRFVDLPVSVDASLIAGEDTVVDDARRVHGRMAVHGRAGDGSMVVLTLSDQGQEWRRELHVFGDEAELRIDDMGYELRPGGGGEVEASREAGEGIGVVDLMARQWRRLLDSRVRGNDGWEAGEDRPEREMEVLACCQACLLSTRTGQAESPRKLWEMNR